jgi:hypothetical protein
VLAGERPVLQRFDSACCPQQPEPGRAVLRLSSRVADPLEHRTQHRLFAGKHLNHLAVIRRGSGQHHRIRFGGADRVNQRRGVEIEMGQLDDLDRFAEDARQFSETAVGRGPRADVHDPWSAHRRLMSRGTLSLDRSVSQLEHHELVEWLCLVVLVLQHLDQIVERVVPVGPLGVVPAGLAYG